MIHLFPGPVSSCLTPSSLLFKLCCWWRLLDRSLIEIFLSYAGQMAQWVKGQAGDLSFISGTHMVEEENQLPQEACMHPHSQSISKLKKKKILLSATISFHGYFPVVLTHFILFCSWPVSDLLPSFFQIVLVIPLPILYWFSPLCNHFKVYHNSYSGRFPHRHPLESQYSKNVFQRV